MENRSSSKKIKAWKINDKDCFPRYAWSGIGIASHAMRGRNDINPWEISTRGKVMGGLIEEK